MATRAQYRRKEASYGYPTGSGATHRISALALVGKPFDVILDDAARELERIHGSAGQRGIDLELRVEDLVAVTGATFVAATAVT